jgi:hypothetical protein
VSALLRCRSSRQLQVVLGLALMALVLAPTASGAAQLDKVTATGSAPGCCLNINISAQSGTSGQNPSGTVSFDIPVPPNIVGPVTFSGPVTCMSVTGPDHGAGAPGAPTTAVLNFQTGRIVLTVELVDNGGNGADVIGGIELVDALRAPTDCSPLDGSPGAFTTPLTNGRATVFDAPVLPTSKDQCKDGGWRNFGSTFKNQGDCVNFVATHGKSPPG